METSKGESILNKDILATVHSVDDIACMDRKSEKYGIIIKDILNHINKETNDMDSVFSACYKYMAPFMSPISFIQDYSMDLKIHVFIMALYNIRYLKAGNSVIKASDFLSTNYVELKSANFENKFNYKENIGHFTIYKSKEFAFEPDEKRHIEQNLKKATDITNILYNWVKLGSFTYIQDFLPILACSSQKNLFEPKMKNCNFPEDYQLKKTEPKFFNRNFKDAIKNHVDNFNKILDKCNKYYGENDLVSRLLCYYKLEYVMKCDFLNDSLNYMRSCDRENIYEEIRIACRLRNVLSRGRILFEFADNRYYRFDKNGTEHETDSSMVTICNLEYLADFFMPTFENIFLSVLMHIYNGNIDTLDKTLTKYISQHLKDANSFSVASPNLELTEKYAECVLSHFAWEFPLTRILSLGEWNLHSNTMSKHRTLEREIDLDKKLLNGLSDGEKLDCADFKKPTLHKNEQLRKLVRILTDTDSLISNQLLYNNASLQLTDGQIIYHMFFINVNMRNLLTNSRSFFPFDAKESQARISNPFGIVNSQEFDRLCCAYKLFYSAASNNSCADFIFMIHFPMIWEHIEPCLLYLIKTISAEEPFSDEIVLHEKAMEDYLGKKSLYARACQPLPSDYIKPKEQEILLRLCQDCIRW